MNCGIIGSSGNVSVSRGVGRFRTSVDLGASADPEASVNLKASVDLEASANAEASAESDRRYA